jgi:hypothetical protein
MKGLFVLVLLAALGLVVKSQEPEIRRYLKIRAM